MRKLTSSAKLIMLGVWLLVACVAYYGALYLGFIYIVPVFLAFITVVMVLYLLVNGGFTSISKELRRKDGERDFSDRPNPFKLSLDKRAFWGDVLLILGVVPLAVILVDYMLILFGIIK